MEDEKHVSTTEARSASTPGIARYVLGISLALILVTFAIILFVGFR